MARPRAFDENQALDAAVDCFWRNGFDAASVRALAAEMGIAGPSLYNAFGDKRALFRVVLERYGEQYMAARIAALEAELPPKARIVAFFEAMIERAATDPEQRGCLLINAALDVAPHDAEMAAVIAARIDEMEAFFARAIAQAQRDGELCRGLDAAGTARLLLGVLVAMRALARSRPDRAYLEGLVRPALALLDQPSQAPTKRGKR